jgi:fido (protein-threonine AMPylation protein)
VKSISSKAHGATMRKPIDCIAESGRPQQLSLFRAVASAYSIARSSSVAAPCVKPIERIDVGDLVLAWNESTAEQVKRPVVRLFRHRKRPITVVRAVSQTGGEEIIRSTTDHPFWVSRKGWVAACALTPGDELQCIRGGEQLFVVDASVENARADVHNFEVLELHNYFVGACGVLVHNSSNENSAASDAGPDTVPPSSGPPTARNSASPETGLSRIAATMHPGSPPRMIVHTLDFFGMTVHHNGDRSDARHVNDVLSRLKNNKIGNLLLENTKEIGGTMVFDFSTSAGDYGNHHPKLNTIVIFPNRIQDAANNGSKLFSHDGIDLVGQVAGVAAHELGHKRRMVLQERHHDRVAAGASYDPEFQSYYGSQYDEFRNETFRDAFLNQELRDNEQFFDVPAGVFGGTGARVGGRVNTRPSVQHRQSVWKEFVQPVYGKRAALGKDPFDAAPEHAPIPETLRSPPSVGSSMRSVSGATGGAPSIAEMSRFEQRKLIEVLQIDPAAFATSYHLLQSALTIPELDAHKQILNVRRYSKMRYESDKPIRVDDSDGPPELFRGSSLYASWQKAASYVDTQAQEGKLLGTSGIQQIHRMLNVVFEDSGKIRSAEGENVIACGKYGPLGMFSVLNPKEVASFNGNSILGLEGAGVLDDFFVPPDLAAKGYTSGIVHYPAGPAVPMLMQRFDQWQESARYSLSPVPFAAESQRRLVSIHPFKDGNGRTSRLVLDHAIQLSGLPPPMLDYNQAFQGIMAHYISPEWEESLREGVVRTFRDAADRLRLP